MHVYAVPNVYQFRSLTDLKVEARGAILTLNIFSVAGSSALIRPPYRLKMSRTAA